MADQYYSILTSAGSKKIAEKLALKEKVVLTKIALGKGTLAEPIPFGTSALADQVFKDDIDAVGLDADNAFIVVVDFILSADKALASEVILTEIGIYDEDDVLIAVGRIPATTIPAKGSASAREVVFQVKFEVDSKDSITLRVFPSAFTKKQWVLDLIVNNLTYSANKADNVLSAHQGYVLDQKKVNIADIVDNVSTGDPKKALSANMGKVLEDSKADINDDVTFKTVQILHSGVNAKLQTDGSGQLEILNAIKTVNAHFTSGSGNSGTALNVDGNTMLGGSGSTSYKLEVSGNTRLAGSLIVTTLSSSSLSTGSVKDGDGNTVSGIVKASDNAYYLEWSDGNPNGEDRLGQPVYFVGDKIAIADKNTPADQIKGVVSATATIVLNTQEFYWKDKYLFDDWGRPLTKKGKKLSWVGSDGTSYNHYENDPPVGVKVPTKRTDKNQLEITDVVAMPLINKKYDPKKAYIPRKDRPEWAVIGLLGTVYVAKNAPVNPRWVKLKSHKVNDLYFIG